MVSSRSSLDSFQSEEQQSAPDVSQDGGFFRFFRDIWRFSGFWGLCPEHLDVGEIGAWEFRACDVENGVANYFPRIRERAGSLRSCEVRIG